MLSNFTKIDNFTKKDFFVATLFVVIAIVGGWSLSIQVATAELLPVTQPPTQQPVNLSGITFPQVVTPTPPVTSNTPGPLIAKPAETVKPAKTLGNNGPDPSAEPSDLVTAAVGMIGEFLLWIGGMVTYVGGLALDGSISYLIVNMKDKIPLAAINSIWGTVRDVCNLAFIFGFLYLGFQTVFDPHKAETKRSLASIIIGALLINFSLFFVKFIIDIGNFVTITIYNAGQSAFPVDASISDVLVQILSLSSLTGSSGAEVLKEMNAGTLFTYYLLSFIFLIFAGFIFLMAAIMLVTRFVTLIFIMIASPILFAGSVFAQGHHMVSDMWQKLITSAIYPAVYLFLVYVSLKMIADFKMIIGMSNAPIAKTLQEGGTSAELGSILMLFIVAMFLMWESLVIAKKLADSGHGLLSTATQNVQKYVGKTVGATTAGLAARGLRMTAGRVGSHFAESESLKEKAKTHWFYRRAIDVSRVASDATYDVRNAPGGDKLGMGAGRKGGHKTILKEEAEKKAAYATSMGIVDDTDPQVKLRKAEMEHAEHELHDAKDKLTQMKKQKERDESELKKVERELAIAIQTNDSHKMLELSNQKAELEKDIVKSTKKVDDQKDVVEEREDDVADTKANYETEKNRRQIGGSFRKNPEEAKAISDFRKDIRAQNIALKHALHTYAENVNPKPGENAITKVSRESNLNISKSAIAALEESIKKAKKDRDAYITKSSDGGMAALSEKSFFVSMLLGTPPHITRAAGKKLRKKASEGVLKAEEVKSHGKGGDDHGAKPATGQAKGGDAHGGGHH